MGLLSDYNAKFASRLELLRAGMEEVMAEAHRELESFNADFIGIYNELHKTLHAEGRSPPAEGRPGRRGKGQGRSAHGFAVRTAQDRPDRVRTDYHTGRDGGRIMIWHAIAVWLLLNALFIVVMWRPK